MEEALIMPPDAVKLLTRQIPDYDYMKPLVNGDDLCKWAWHTGSSIFLSNVSHIYYANRGMIIISSASRHRNDNRQFYKYRTATMTNADTTSVAMSDATSECAAYRRGEVNGRWSK